MNQIQEIKFNQRTDSLWTKRTHKQSSPKLVFVTDYCDDIPRIRRTFRKHWNLIKQNQTLRQIFPDPPIIAFRRNPSLRNKLVRAKLKPINVEDVDNTPTAETKTHYGNFERPQDYPFNLFTTTLQNYRNPIKRCKRTCLICNILETRCFAESTTLTQKYPINPPPPSQFYNCNTRNIIYLITCTETGCRTQYVGYTTRPLKHRATEHLSDPGSPIRTHCDTLKHDLKKIKFQIVLL